MSVRHLIKKYCLISGILTIFMLSGLAYIDYVNKHFPENIYLSEQSDATFNLSVPVTGSVYSSDNVTNNANADFSHEVTFVTGNANNYNMDLHLFGFIFLKTINVNVVDNVEVYPCGFQAGLYLKSDGVLVVRTDSINTSDYGNVNPCEHIISKGDYILKVDDQPISSKKEFADIINASNGNKISLSILRNKEIIDVSVTPVLSEDNEYKLGLWVKDDAQGIGTITYIDKENHFGALGHGITDNSTGTILNIKNGKLYNTRIISIVKGKNGTPGELQGIIDYQNTTPIGDINKNCEYGIYGSIDEVIVKRHDLQLMSIGYRYNVHKGKAYVRFYRNNKYQDYEINITSLSNGGLKNISFKVTSPELLDMTNGIVQGMSGCPIIQDDKIIGAVTHVLIDDSQSGYGIYIENMLNSSD